LLSQFGITTICHYAPLHYLPFIARRGALLSKAELRRKGFADTHLRSTSSAQDERRGFSDYVHLTLDAHPPILRAKLARGFPHFEVAIPAPHFAGLEYLLCRFNIAKTRYFRGAKREPPECDKNGHYYEEMRLPVAMTEAEREALLRLNYGQQMIEVLVRDQMPLGEGTSFRFFSHEDLASATQVLQAVDIATYALQIDEQLQYSPSPNYRQAVAQALARAVSDPAWLGSGLEFDRV
jgi:hypothetical protein